MKRFFFLVFLLVTAVPATAQWIESPRTGWLQVILYHHDTRRQFDSQSEIQRFPDEGHAVTTSLYLTGAVGLIRGIDAWAQVPVHRLQFDDIVGDRTSTGFGDPRLSLRAGPALFGLQNIPVAVRGGVKFPGGSFPIDAEIIPLGEGQRDWELMLEAGWSFYPRPVYAAGWIGYRWRERNDEIARKPGDERFGYLAVGGSWNHLSWKLAAEVIRGDPLMAQGLRLVTARRQMFQVLPTIGYGIGPGTFELGGRLPLQGRNLPAGPTLSLGYFLTWGR